MTELLELLSFPFFRNALWGIAVISIASALIGTYIVSRRMVFVSGGITHACFGGLGFGYWLGVSPMAMAALFAVGSSLGVDWLASRQVRRDSAIAVVWALGMALGILFISLSTGNVPELNAFLFGNILTISDADLWMFAGFTLLLIIWYLLFFPLIEAVSFDQDFARTRHLPVRWINLGMTVLVALGIVLTIRMIGIMLLMSLLSLPQMTAELFARRYLHLILLSSIISLIGCLSGLFLSALINVPASAAIVLILIFLYLLVRILRNASSLSGWFRV